MIFFTETMGNKNGHVKGIQKGNDKIENHHWKHHGWSEIEEVKKLFHCQLAHGSSTCVISGFTNVKELYTKIAQSYDMLSSEVIDNVKN